MEDWRRNIGKSRADGGERIGRAEGCVNWITERRDRRTGRRDRGMWELYDGEKNRGSWEL